MTAIALSAATVKELQDRYATLLEETQAITTLLNGSTPPAPVSIRAATSSTLPIVPTNPVGEPVLWGAELSRQATMLRWIRDHTQKKNIHRFHLGRMASYYARDHEVLAGIARARLQVTMSTRLRYFRKIGARTGEYQLVVK